MMARLPILPTVVVTIAAAAMVGLGFWQLGRAEEKAQMIAAYSVASTDGSKVAFPLTGNGESLWFQPSTVRCEEVVRIEPVAGTARDGRKGWAQRVICAVPDRDATVIVDLGFSRDPAAADWNGGLVEGIIAPGPRLVATQPVADLQTLAPPNPSDLPNNHLAYAWQWFFFALTAVAIYSFAVRSRMTRRP